MAALRFFGFSFIALLAIFLALNSLVVFADQPVLPTFFYGLVINPDGTPAEAVDVSASWTDNDGNQKSITTKTLSESDVSDPVYLGHYFFTQGFVQAKEGSTIRISSSGVDKTIKAVPGGDLILVDAIVLGSSSESGQGAECTVINCGSGIGDGSTSSTGQSQGQGSGSADGAASGSDSGSGSGSGDGSGSGIGEGAGSGVPNADDLISELPDEFTKNFRSSNTSNQYSGNSATTIFGQLLDQYGSPISGKEVVAEWTDETGYHKEKTTTLTKEEAASMGNTSLEGYYKFDQGQIQPSGNSTITLKTNDGVKRAIPPKPGSVLKADLQQSSDVMSDKPSGQFGSIFINSTQNMVFTVGKKIKGNYFTSAILLAILIISIGLFYSNKIKKNIFSLMSNYSKAKLSVSAARLDTVKASSIMTTKLISIDQDESLQNLLRLFMSENVGSLLVASGKSIVGIVTERDVLRRIDFASDQPAVKSVKRIMTEILKTVNQNCNLSRLIDFSLKNHVRKIPITKDKKIVGLVTQTDIMKTFYEFFNTYKFRSQDIPIVKGMMSDSLALATNDERLGDVLNFMIKDDLDAIIVIKKDGSDSVEGFITERDILGEYYNNSSRFNLINVGQVAHVNIFSVIPGTTIIEANKIMIENNVRRLIVMVGKEPVGIVTQTDLIIAMRNFLKELSDKEVKAGIKVDSE